MQEEESFIEAYLMELEAEKEVEFEEDIEEVQDSESEEVEPEPEVESQAALFFEEIPEESFEETVDCAENTEDSEVSEEPNLLPARGTCRRKPLRNCYREEKGVQRNSWRKEKWKWRLS